MGGLVAAKHSPSRTLALGLLTLTCLTPLASADVWGYVPDVELGPGIKFIGSVSICVVINQQSGCTVCIVLDDQSDLPVYVPGSGDVGTGFGLPRGDPRSLGPFGPFYGVWVNAGNNCKAGVA